MAAGVRLVSRVVVGSRLHGLADADSDWDLREVVVSPLIAMISPFRSQRVKHQNPATSDDVRFELSHFVKYLVQGNPTMLEILWSDQVQVGGYEWSALWQNRHKVLDSDRVFSAHRGYSTNQRRRCLEEYGDTPKAMKVRGKFIAASIRVLIQGADLLDRGDFYPRVRPRIDASLVLPELLSNARKGITRGEMEDIYLPLVVRLEDRLAAVYDTAPSRTANIDWVEHYLYRTYTQDW